MSLVKKTSAPFLSDSLSDFFNSESKFFDDFFKKDATPAVNIKEDDKSYHIEAVVPGFNKDEIKVEVHDGILYISGESKNEKESKDKNFTRKEFSYSSFNRSFVLPEGVKEDDIQANYKSGILNLELNKETTRIKPTKKTIEVK